MKGLQILIISISSLCINAQIVTNKLNKSVFLPNDSMLTQTDTLISFQDFYRIFHFIRNNAIFNDTILRNKITIVQTFLQK